MTTYAQASVTCGACRRVFTHQELMSTNSFGSPDLDTRPAEMQRSTMHAWIQRCPSCGYCAPDAEMFAPSLRAVLESADYQDQLADSRYPTLATTFMCAALLALAQEKHAEAGWSYLRAAWVLDDAREIGLAALCRGKAADVFLALLRQSQTFVSQPGASEAVLIDCLRRAQRGAEALPLIEQALGQPHEELQDVIVKVLRLQRQLIQQGDTDVHQIAEALES
jgi:Uncharacterized protein conserved in bacteria (DUF2225)